MANSKEIWKCLKKVRYDSELQAERAGRQWALTRGDAGLRPYQCNHCGKFHLTSKRVEDAPAWEYNKHKAYRKGYKIKKRGSDRS